MDLIFTQTPVYQLILIGIFIVTFIIQLIYWLKYSAISKYRNRHRVATGEQLPSVSVIVIAETLDYIENGLPLLLEQEHPDFEVVVVNDCGGIDVDDELEKLSRAYKNLKFTTLKKDDKFNHSRKIPLVIGMKAAKHENIIITDTDALPTNEKWLSYMCRGFSGADLVIGYTGFELNPGLANKLFRCSRLATSIRYLSSAISGRPYRGIYNNIGYTKTIFFDNRGYTNLSMTIGEDDLFVQRIAKRCSTSVIINPQSTMRQGAFTTVAGWWSKQKYHTYSFRYYPRGVKLSVFTELCSRGLFFALTITLAILSATQIITIPYLWVGAIVMFALRELTLWLSVKKITKRLGEIKIIGTFIAYDLFAPIIEMILGISRRISPPKSLWIQNSK